METTIKCEECNMFGTIMEDSKSGDFVCTNCGVVSQQSFIFHQYNPTFMSIDNCSINHSFKETLEQLKESDIHVERCVELYGHMKKMRLMRGTMIQNVICMLYLTKMELGVYEDVGELCKVFKVNSRKVQLLLNHYQKEYKSSEESVHMKTIQNLIMKYGKQCSVGHEVIKKALMDVEDVMKLEKSSRMYACILLGYHGGDIEKQLAKVSLLQKSQIKKCILEFKKLKIV